MNAYLNYILLLPRNTIQFFFLNYYSCKYHCMKIEKWKCVWFRCLETFLLWNTRWRQIKSKHVQNKTVFPRDYDNKTLTTPLNFIIDPLKFTKTRHGETSVDPAVNSGRAANPDSPCRESPSTTQPSRAEAQGRTASQSGERRRHFLLQVETPPTDRPTDLTGRCGAPGELLVSRKCDPVCKSNCACAVSIPP